MHLAGSNSTIFFRGFVQALMPRNTVLGARSLSFQTTLSILQWVHLMSIQMRRAPSLEGAVT